MEKFRMRKNTFSFIFDNKSNNWFMIDVKSNKYKFYAKISKDIEVKEWCENFKKVCL